VAPPVSILKPVRGLDEDFDEAILSHALQDYPEFEILFGVASLDDPAVPAIRRLIAAHPECAIRLVHSQTAAPNGKVGVLIDLAREARHGILLVNDSDISVPPDYLRRVVAPLRLPDIGLVTCLYRAASSSFAGKWEAFGIASISSPPRSSPLLWVSANSASAPRSSSAARTSMPSAASNPLPITSPMTTSSHGGSPAEARAPISARSSSRPT
jgi:hypothetical protein